MATSKSNSSSNGSSGRETKPDEALKEALRDLTAAVQDAKVLTEDGAVLTTESGVLVSSAEALQAAKDIARDHFVSVASAPEPGQTEPNRLEPEQLAALSDLASQLIDASFDRGLNTVSPQEAAQVVEGYQLGMATAGLSMHINDMQGVADKVGTDVLVNGNAETQLQALETAKSHFDAAHGKGIAAVDELSPAVDALEGIRLPSTEQLEVMRTMLNLEGALTDQLNARGPDAPSLSAIATDLREFADKAEAAFEGTSTDLASSLRSMADAVEKGDSSALATAFSQTEAPTEDFLKNALTEYIISAKEPLNHAQDAINEVAPTANEGMERFAEAMKTGADYGDDLVRTLAHEGANAEIFAQAVADRGADFEEALNALNQYREVALDALAERMVMANSPDGRGNGTVEREYLAFESEDPAAAKAGRDSNEHGRVESEITKDPSREGVSDRGEAETDGPQAEAEMEMSL